MESDPSRDESMAEIDVKRSSVMVNRASVLTLWVAVVAEVFVGRGALSKSHILFSLFLFPVPAENAPKQTQNLVLKSLDPKFSLLYIQLTPKRALINFRIVSGSE